MSIPISRMASIASGRTRLGSVPALICEQPMIIKFGKYRGRPIAEVPTDYLEWILDQNQRMTAAIEQELERRRQGEGAEVSWVEQVIRSGYREMAKRHHPDVGGSDEEMRQLNAAVEYLRELSAERPAPKREAS